MRFLRALFFLVVGCVLVVVLFPPVRIALLAVLLIPHFFPGDVARPLEWITPAPTVETITVPGAPGRMVADVYRPAGVGRRPTMVLFLGVNPLPRTHPQVTTLAQGIARTGMVAVVAESQALLDGEIRTEEVDNLVALFQYLERDPGVEPTRIGFAGFCIGGVLELLAAEDDRIADRVAYVNAFSVYADATEVLASIITESQPGPNGPEPWTPSDLTRKVFVHHIIQQVPLARDRELLTRAFVEGAPLAFGATDLSAAGAPVLQLLVTRDPAEVERLLRMLPPDSRAALDRLSPARAASRIRARVFLMHDANDTYLPLAGARKLAAAMPPEARVRYTELRSFNHVVPGNVDDPKQLAGEMLKLIGHVNAVLQTALAS